MCTWKNILVHVTGSLVCCSQPLFAYKIVKRMLKRSECTRARERKKINHPHILSYRRSLSSWARRSYEEIKGTTTGFYAVGKRVVYFKWTKTKTSNTNKLFWYGFSSYLLKLLRSYKLTCFYSRSKNHHSYAKNTLVLSGSLFAIFCWLQMYVILTLLAEVFFLFYRFYFLVVTLFPGCLCCFLSPGKKTLRE